MGLGVRCERIPTLGVGWVGRPVCRDTLPRIAGAGSVSRGGTGPEGAERRAELVLCSAYREDAWKET